MPRSKNGRAIDAARLTVEEIVKLVMLQREAEAKGDLPTWRRATAVLGYAQGKKVISLSEHLDVTRGSINHWLGWFNAAGTDGLRPRPRPGAPPRLSEEQQAELVTIIEAGPQAAGFFTGIWTGPMIGDLIHRRFGVRYHNHYVPHLLHKLGFSVQRPRKRLARADLARQEVWMRKTFPSIKKKRPPAEEKSCSATKPASGSTGRSTEPGPA
jgi:putative transposase